MWTGERDFSSTVYSQDVFGTPVIFLQFLVSTWRLIVHTVLLLEAPADLCLTLRTEEPGQWTDWASPSWSSSTGDLCSLLNVSHSLLNVLFCFISSTSIKERLQEFLVICARLCVRVCTRMSCCAQLVRRTVYSYNAGLEMKRVAVIASDILALCSISTSQWGKPTIASDLWLRQMTELLFKMF